MILVTCVPLGGDADQDAHHGLTGRSHQAAERGGGRRAGCRTAGRGHHLPLGQRLPGAGVLAPPEAPAPQAAGAQRRLGRAAGRGGAPVAHARGAAGSGASGAVAERPGGAAGAAAGGAHPARRPGRTARALRTAPGTTHSLGTACMSCRAPGTTRGAAHMPGHAPGTACAPSRAREIGSLRVLWALTQQLSGLRRPTWPSLCKSPAQTDPNGPSRSLSGQRRPRTGAAPTGIW